MKKDTAGILSVLAFVYMIGISVPLGQAATPRGWVRDLAVLEISITLLDENARLAMEAGLVVKERLSDKFGLTLGEVDGLLGPNITYGELATVLTFAERMSGGVTDENINKVVNLRKSGTRWDQIAEKLQLNLSGIARSVSRFENAAHSRIKEALAEFGLSSATVG